MSVEPAWPETDAEWVDAIRAAVWAIGLDAAKAYGLVDGPDVDVERCEELLARGRELGHWIPDLADVLGREAGR